MKDHAAIDLWHNSLRTALPSNTFCGGKIFSLSNFQFKSEKHWQEFPYKEPPFRPQSLKVKKFGKWNLVINLFENLVPVDYS